MPTAPAKGAELLRKSPTAAAATPVRPVKVSPEGIVVAIVAVTGIEDTVRDLIVPGAFAHTLRVRRPKVVDDHEWKNKVGRVLHVEEWMPGDSRLPKTTKDGKPWPPEAGALVATMQYNLRSPRGAEAYEWVRFYAESNEAEFSIGYRVPDEHARRRRDGVRLILRVDLFEFSHVLFGAAPLSMALEVKSFHGGTAGEVTVPAITGADDDDTEDYDDVPTPDPKKPWETAKATREAKTAAAAVLEAKAHSAAWAANEGNPEHLRRWFVAGADGAIPWGEPGDFDACVAIASKHMTPDQAKGYCNLRHHDALGIYPATHAKLEGKAATENGPDSFIPPKDVQAAAKRGLELRGKFKRGGTEVGVARARDLSSGGGVSMSTLRRMNSFFARHEVDKSADGWGSTSDPSAGYIAWLLWGGDPGKRWAASKAKTETKAAPMEGDDQPDFSNGIMVAVYPDPAAVSAVSEHLDGGLPEEALHVTLAYLGRTDDPGVDDADTLIGKVRAAAAGYQPLAGQLAGLGLFPDNGDGAVSWAPVDVPGLSGLREAIVAALGDQVVSTHGFTPHMTLGYGLTGVDPVPATPVTFGAVSVVYGTDRTDIALTTSPHSEDTPMQTKSHRMMRGSYQEQLAVLREAAEDLLRTALHITNGNFGVSPIATYANEGVYEVWVNNDERSYLIPHTFDEDGRPELGEPRRVELSLVAEPETDDEEPDEPDEDTVQLVVAVEPLATQIAASERTLDAMEGKTADRVRARVAELKSALATPINSGREKDPAEVETESEDDPAEYTRDNLPSEGWSRFRKVAPIEAMPMAEPFTVETREGKVSCEKGWLAKDSEGYPYPIADEEMDQVYVPETAEKAAAVDEDEAPGEDADGEEPTEVDTDTEPTDDDLAAIEAEGLPGDDPSDYEDYGDDTDQDEDGDGDGDGDDTVTVDADEHARTMANLRAA